MNLIRLSWKNLIHKPGSMILSLILISLGVGLISFLLLLDHQVQNKFEKNLAGIDLVLGAKGSPLQLILNSMYHIDAPTGNISLEEIQPFINPKNPLVEQAVPLSLGDSYGGFRIVGTTNDFLELYDLQVSEGKNWTKPYEVVIGRAVADDAGLALEEEFKSTHGFLEDEQMEHSHGHDFKVVGILEASGSVADQLILTGISTYWYVHGEENIPPSDTMTPDSTHQHHEHGHTHPQKIYGKSEELLQAEDSREITSLLLTFSGRSFQSLNLARNINENTDLQAASPAIEINRLFSLMDTGAEILRILALAIIIVSGLSIFISLFSKMRARKYELAFMRVKGASRRQLFSLIILEGLMIAAIGMLIGVLAAHLAIYYLSVSIEENYKYTFTAFTFLTEEGLVCLGALVLGGLASLIPAWQASRTDISETLSQ